MNVWPGVALPPVSGTVVRRGPWIAAAVIGLALYALGDVATRDAVATLRGALAPNGVADSGMLMLMALYVLLMALPFVPGLELGVALMLLLGHEGVAAVYAGTQAALLLSFVCGRHLCGRVSWPRWLRRFMTALAAPASGVPGRFGPRHHVGLALLLNLPGNGVLGGAGGIAMLAGASGRFTLPAYCLTVAVATSPVPLLMLTGLVAFGA